MFAQTSAVLNLDVFRVILGFLSMGDLLPITYASRFVRNEVHKEMLSRPIHLNGFRRVEPFCHFMVADGMQRCSLLRALILDGTLPFGAGVEEVVVQILRRATNLRSLCIFSHELSSNSGIYQAISQLPFFHTLGVQTSPQPLVKRHTMGMILTLPLTLKSLTVRNIVDEDFLSRLAKHHTHLEKLSILLSTFRTLRCQPFVHVHVLILVVTDKPVLLPLLVESFPHLRELTLRASSYRDSAVECPSTFPQDLVALQNAGKGWNPLYFISGTLQDLSILSLTCLAKRVSFHDPFHEGTHKEYMDVISRARPFIIELPIYSTQDTRYRDGPTVEDSILAQKDSMVSHVVLRLTIEVLRKPTTQRMLEDVSLVLQNSRVEYLRLAIADYHTEEADDFTFSENERVSEGLAEFIDRIDPPSFALGLAEMCPSLRMVVLSLVTRGRSFWMMDGERNLKRLDAYTGEGLMHFEERRYLQSSSDS